MSFTVATILAFNGERGIAESGLGEKIYFDRLACPQEELPAIRPGVTVIYTLGSIELATSSFVHYQQEIKELHEGVTAITETE